MGNVIGLMLSAAVGIVMFIYLMGLSGGAEDRYHPDGTPSQSVLSNGKE